MQNNDTEFDRKPHRWMSRRVAVHAAVIVAAGLFVLWWSRGAMPVPTIPGTVREVSLDGRPLKAFSHPEFGIGAFSIAGPGKGQRFLSEKLPQLDIGLPSSVSQAGKQLRFRQFACHVLADQKFVLLNHAGLQIHDLESNSGHHIELRIDAKPFRDDRIITADDQIYHDGVLTVAFSAPDDKGAPATWQARFNLSAVDSVDAVIFPEQLTRLPIETRTASTLLGERGDTWATLESLLLVTVADRQRLFFSDGTAVDLPVETVGTPEKQTSSIYFHIESTVDLNRIAAFRVTADQSAIELVDIVRPGVEATPRPPLRLPASCINTKICSVGPNGRYVALTSADFQTTTLPVISKWFPSLRQQHLTHDLVVVDLVEWTVAAAQRDKRTVLGNQWQILWMEPTISHDGQHVLVPQFDKVLVIDINQWREHYEKQHVNP